MRHRTHGHSRPLEEIPAIRRKLLCHTRFSVTEPAPPQDYLSPTARRSLLTSPMQLRKVVQVLFYHSEVPSLLPPSGRLHESNRLRKKKTPFEDSRRSIHSLPLPTKHGQGMTLEAIASTRQKDSLAPNSTVRLSPVCAVIFPMVEGLLTAAFGVLKFG